jgi:glycosyltransferase involved in cell wall biosynthesis
MRICFLSDPGYLHTRRWARFFAERGHTVQVVGGSIEPSPDIPGVAVRPLNAEAFTGPWTLRTTLALRRSLRQFEPDILHMHYLGPLVAPVLLRFRPFVVSVWGADVLGERGLAAESRRSRFVKTLVLRRAHAVLAISRYLAEATCRYAALPTHRVLLYRWGVDLSQFRPVREAPVSTDRQTPVVIGFVKHLEPKYGAEYLLRAVPVIRTRHPAITVAIVGDGSLRAHLEQVARSLGITDVVTFRGAVAHDQVPRHMAAMDIFVMPSVHVSESFGVAALEAQAMGLPVVASRIGGVPEAVAEGRTALLVPPRDPAALAEAVVRLIEDVPLRRSMSQEGRRFVTERYDWHANAGEVETLYRGLLGQGGKKEDR